MFSKVKVTEAEKLLLLALLLRGKEREGEINSRESNIYIGCVQRTPAYSEKTLLCFGKKNACLKHKNP